MPIFKKNKTTNLQAQLITKQDALASSAVSKQEYAGQLQQQAIDLKSEATTESKQSEAVAQAVALLAAAGVS